MRKTKQERAEPRGPQGDRKHCLFPDKEGERVRSLSCDYCGRTKHFCGIFSHFFYCAFMGF